jgi:hypothetical protein
MPRIIATWLLVILISVSALAQTNEVFMIGPMLHLNIANKKRPLSFGIELSYWNYDNFPYSVDGCVEFEKGKIRLYSEVQTGIGVAGISAGPVLEFQTTAHAVKVGYQASIWGNYFLGFDVRLRRIGKETYICPGIYGKLPFGYGEGPDGDNDWDWDSDWD